MLYSTNMKIYILSCAKPKNLTFESNNQLLAMVVEMTQLYIRDEVELS